MAINRFWSDVYSTALRETTDQSSLASLELIQMSSKKLNLNHLLYNSISIFQWDVLNPTLG